MPSRVVLRIARRLGRSAFARVSRRFALHRLAFANPIALAVECPMGVFALCLSCAGRAGVVCGGMHARNGFESCATGLVRIAQVAAWDWIPRPCGKAKPARILTRGQSCQGFVCVLGTDGFQFTNTTSQYYPDVWIELDRFAECRMLRAACVQG